MLAYINARINYVRILYAVLIPVLYIKYYTHPYTQLYIRMCVCTLYTLVHTDGQDAKAFFKRLVPCQPAVVAYLVLKYYLIIFVLIYICIISCRYIRMYIHMHT